MNERAAAAIVQRTIAQYNRIAPDFDRTRNQSEDCSALAAYVKRGFLVLDVGCGNGRLVPVLRDTGINLIGCDASEKLIASCREKYADDMRAGWLGFTVADALTLPFDGKQFDVVFALAMLHHIPSGAMRQSLMRDLHAITKRDGRCVGTVWNLRSSAFRERYSIDEQLSKPKSGWDSGDVEIPWRASGDEEVLRYCHAFTTDELRELFESSGWHVESLYPVARDFTQTSDERAHNLFWVIRA